MQRLNPVRVCGEEVPKNTALCSVFLNSVKSQFQNFILIISRRLKKGAVSVADLNPITLGMCTLMELPSWRSLTDVPLLELSAGFHLQPAHLRFKSDCLPPFSGGLVLSDYLKRAPGVSIPVNSRKSYKDFMNHNSGVLTLILDKMKSFCVYFHFLYRIYVPAFKIPSVHCQWLLRTKFLF